MPLFWHGKMSNKGPCSSALNIHCVSKQLFISKVQQDTNSFSIAHLFLTTSECGLRDLNRVVFSTVQLWSDHPRQDHSFLCQFLCASWDVQFSVIISLKNTRNHTDKLIKLFLVVNEDRNVTAFEYTESSIHTFTPYTDTCHTDSVTNRFTSSSPIAPRCMWTQTTQNTVNQLTERFTSWLSIQAKVYWCNIHYSCSSCSTS